MRLLPAIREEAFQVRHLSTLSWAPALSMWIACGLHCNCQFRMAQYHQNLAGMHERG